MTTDKNLILRLEKLARLQLSDTEREEIGGDLDKILAMVDKLQEIDTENVEPLTYINEEVNVLRTDAVKNQTDRAAALRNAPNTDGTYFKVPKVIER